MKFKNLFFIVVLMAALAGKFYLDKEKKQSVTTTSTSKKLNDFKKDDVSKNMSDSLGIKMSSTEKGLIKPILSGFKDAGCITEVWLKVSKDDMKDVIGKISRIIQKPGEGRLKSSLYTTSNPLNKDGKDKIDLYFVEGWKSCFHFNKKYGTLGSDFSEIKEFIKDLKLHSRLLNF